MEMKKAQKQGRNDTTHKKTNLIQEEYTTFVPLYRIWRNFCGKNISCVKFSLRLIFIGQATHKNLAPRIIATTNLETWLQGMRSCACVDSTFATTYGKQQLEKR